MTDEEYYQSGDTDDGKGVNWVPTDYDGEVSEISVGKDNDKYTIMVVGGTRCRKYLYILAYEDMCVRKIPSGRYCELRGEYE